jgi:hypothetical protein
MYDIDDRTSLVDLAAQAVSLQAGDWGQRPPGVKWVLPAEAVLLGWSYSSGATPAWLAYTRGTQLVAVICGVKNPFQAGLIFTGAQSPRAAIGQASVNAVYARVAVPLIQQLLTLARGVNDEVLLTGHSYGGSICSCMAAWLVQIAPQYKLSRFTMGEPRAGDNTLSSVIANVKSVRAMNDGDPVLRWPPHFDEAPLGTIAIGFPAALAFSEYAQTPGGQILGTDGTFSPAVLPPSGPPIADAALLTWLIAGTGLGHPLHNLSTYWQRLKKGASEPGPAVPKEAKGWKGELAVELPQRIFQLGPLAGPPAFTEYETMAGESVYIPPMHRWKALRIGQSYYVLWEEKQIMICPTFSKAKTIAKAGNKMLRVVQNTTSLDMSAFNEAVSLYFQAASDPNGDFSPILLVEQ